MGKSDKNDDLGNRMKSYEKIQTDLSLDKNSFIYARLDGRSFSKFTKRFDYPYDATFSNLMINTTRYLMEQTKACVGYVQSDEISLAWKPVESEVSGFFFEGKIQKLCSVLSGMTTAYFNAHLSDESRSYYPHFDCRILNLPSLSEATNMIVWREIDARKNAISMLARAFFSHKELNKKSGNEMLEMLKDKNVFMDDYCKAFRSGTLLKRASVLKELDDSDKINIPEIYRNKVVRRNVIEEIDVFCFAKIINKSEVIFGNEKAIYVNS